jgi:hypothetical protein
MVFFRLPVLEVSVIRRPVPVRFLVLGALLVLVPFSATRISGQAGGQASQPRVVALRGGTVLTATRGTIPNGTVLLRDGKIAAVGAAITVPSDAQVVDTTGQFVSPGIIDAHSHIANDAINEGGTTVSSMTGMEDVLDATDINIYRDLAGGSPPPTCSTAVPTRSAARTRSSNCAGEKRAPKKSCSRARCRESSSRSAKTPRTCRSAKPPGRVATR